MRRRLAALLTVLLLVSGVAFSKAETAKVDLAYISKLTDMSEEMPEYAHSAEI